MVKVIILNAKKGAPVCQIGIWNCPWRERGLRPDGCPEPAIIHPGMTGYERIVRGSPNPEIFEAGASTLMRTRYGFQVHAWPIHKNDPRTVFTSYVLTKLLDELCEDSWVTFDETPVAGSPTAAALAHIE